MLRIEVKGDQRAGGRTWRDRALAQVPAHLLNACRGVKYFIMSAIGSIGSRFPHWRTLLQYLGSLRWTVACLLWMCVLTVWGTVAQVNPEVGLYGALQRVFRSWWFRGPVGLPLPGMVGTLAVFFVNLLASLFQRFRPIRCYVGLWVLHLGLGLLLVGSWVGVHHARESTVTLAEGQSTSVGVSSHEWELVIIEPVGETRRRVHAWDLRSLRPGQNLPLPGMPDGATVHRVWSSVEWSGSQPPSPEALRSARHVDPERAIPAVVLRVGTDRFALVGEGDALRIPRRDTTDAVFVHLRRTRHPLPITIRLVDFQKEFYPNSRIPRSFESRIEVFDGRSQRPVVISMNRPFRYGPFTFYQSSYIDHPDGPEISVLAVSENRVRLLPYVSCALMFAGMVLHYLSPGRRR